MDGRYDPARRKYIKEAEINEQERVTKTRKLRGSIKQCITSRQIMAYNNNNNKKG
jgi:hypothetical protein